MPRRLVALTFVVIASSAITLQTGGAAADGRSPICTRGNTTVEIDPRGLLPLTANSIGPAVTAAMRSTRRSEKPQVVAAALATADNRRGPQARFACGARVWRRTVVVYVTLRAFANSASLSERVFFVGRFASGYRVWQLVH